MAALLASPVDIKSKATGPVQQSDTRRRLPRLGWPGEVSGSGRAGGAGLVELPALANGPAF